MLDPNTIVEDYDQQVEVCKPYVIEMLKFVSIQQAYLMNHMFPRSGIGNPDNQGAEASMLFEAILSMDKCIKEVDKIDDKVNINELVDSARLACEATREACNNLTAEHDSLGDDTSKSEIKIIKAILNTMLEYVESAFHMAKAMSCITRVIEAVDDAGRTNLTDRKDKRSV